MTAPLLLATLAALALVDSTSVGTLILPVLLLLSSRRPPTGRVLLFLGVVAGLYFLLGVAVLLGAGVLFEALTGSPESTAAYAVQIAVGVGLVVLSFIVEPTEAGKRRRAQRRRERGEDPADGGRLARWRTALTDSRRAVVGVAVAAVGLEVATMLPYLGAIGLMSAHAPNPGAALALLAGYCVVMVLPALTLVGLRVALGARLDGVLTGIERWSALHGSSGVAWILAIIGVALAVQGWGVLNARGVLG